ncbi:MAG: type II secretion system protein N [Oceanococcus sp.]
MTGNLLDGHAGMVQSAGLRADDMSWQLKPAGLLIGRLSAALQLGQMDSIALSTKNEISADGIASYSLLTEQISLRDWSLQAPISALQKAAKLSYLPVQGSVQLNVVRLDLEKQDETLGFWPSELNGTVSVSDINWTLGNAVPLGKLSAALSSGEDQDIVVTISDSESASIDLRGQASLNRDRNYAAQFQLKPKSDTPISLVNQMKALGRTDKQAWYLIKNSGKLPGL